MLETKKIVLLFGRICSGKSTYADALCYITKAKRITVSDIVKKVSGAATRSNLQETSHLDGEIAKELINNINNYEKVVIDGIRQSAIVNRIVHEYGISNIDMIWLDVPEEVRRQRFYARSVSKDDISFEEAQKRDNMLGLEELELKFKGIYKNIIN